MRATRGRGQDRSAQPSAPPTERQIAVRGLAAERASTRGPLLPILHAVVERFGYVDEGDIPVVADVLNLSRADVHGVVSFYTDFRRTPPAAHVVQLCRAEACQSVGAQGLYAATTARYERAEDVVVHEVFCLGNCALGPSGVIDGRLRGRLTEDVIAEALEVSS
ncbi:MAG: NAD(P)H-dependent oxidoreductase subunit E [Nostocoides sp.]